MEANEVEVNEMENDGRVKSAAVKNEQKKGR